ncbi:creatininase family protein [Salarchaeum sp. JOR-1]|uniref:creatininase family protein n=1 Tax=Salarchaeum sp. JOR-1 TaxID=2599399 RepID=UPI001198AD32|nr:creatininase family protein [Salarchaeum sp. JOR-1]QDX39913.1 creatininase family protein [Salarchaeum sp. JOR-1]
MRLSEAAWPDVTDLDPDAVLIPVGSTEQHGPHVPFGTDHFTAETVALSADDAYDGTLAVAPTITVGVSEEHRQFPGTMYVSPDTFRGYVRDAATSVLDHDWRTIVFVNGHGGNTDALREVAADITRHENAYAAAYTWFDAVGDHSADMGHAGPLETAFLRHTHPGLVREDRVEDARDGASDGWGDWTSYTNLAYDSAEFSENGVVGDPTEGTRERGEALLSLATDALCRLVAELGNRDTARPPHK